MEFGVLIDNISGLIWGGTWGDDRIIPLPPMVLILFGVGMWIMVGLRFYPLRQLGAAFKGLFAGRKSSGDGEISPFAALFQSVVGLDFPVFFSEVLF